MYQIKSKLYIEIKSTYKNYDYWLVQTITNGRLTGQLERIKKRT